MSAPSPLDAAAVNALERLFHEPSRLALMAALCASPRGVPFTVLRETCSLTDGNLNRHLKTLEEQGAVRIEKSFVDQKPRTTVYATREGLERFREYLDSLQQVLQQARRAAQATAHPTRKAMAAAAHA